MKSKHYAKCLIKNRQETVLLHRSIRKYWTPHNAAGVAGLINAAMVLHREQIPATLHFKKPNPKIDFANSPFMIATG